MDLSVSAAPQKAWQHTRDAIGAAAAANGSGASSATSDLAHWPQADCSTSSAYPQSGSIHGVMHPEILQWCASSTSLGSSGSSSPLSPLGSVNTVPVSPASSSGSSAPSSSSECSNATSPTATDSSHSSMHRSLMVWKSSAPVKRDSFRYEPHKRHKKRLENHRRYDMRRRWVLNEIFADIREGIAESVEMLTEAESLLKKEHIKTEKDPAVKTEHSDHTADETKQVSLSLSSSDNDGVLDLSSLTCEERMGPIALSQCELMELCVKTIHTLQNAKDRLEAKYRAQQADEMNEDSAADDSQAFPEKKRRYEQLYTASPSPDSISSQSTTDSSSSTSSSSLPISPDSPAMEQLLEQITYTLRSYAADIQLLRTSFSSLFTLPMGISDRSQFLPPFSVVGLNSQQILPILRPEILEQRLDKNQMIVKFKEGTFRNRCRPGALQVNVVAGYVTKDEGLMPKKEWLDPEADAGDVSGCDLQSMLQWVHSSFHAENQWSPYAPVLSSSASSSMPSPEHPLARYALSPGSFQNLCLVLRWLSSLDEGEFQTTFTILRNLAVASVPALFPAASPPSPLLRFTPDSTPYSAHDFYFHPLMSPTLENIRTFNDLCHGRVPVAPMRNVRVISPVAQRGLIADCDVTLLKNPVSGEPIAFICFLKRMSFITIPSAPRERTGLSPNV